MYIGYKRTEMVNGFKDRRVTWIVFDIGDRVFTDDTVDNIREYLFNKVTPFVDSFSTYFFRDTILTQISAITEEDGKLEMVTDSGVITTSKDLVTSVDYEEVLKSTGVLVLDEDYNRVVW